MTDKGIPIVADAGSKIHLKATPSSDASGRYVLGVSVESASVNVSGTFIDDASGPVAPGSPASKSDLIGGIYNTTPPALTNGQQAALQSDIKGRLQTSSAPASSLVTITPSDATVLSTSLRAIYVGGSGNLVVMAFDDVSAVTLIGVTAGTIIPIRAKKVMAATTATNLVGFI